MTLPFLPMLLTFTDICYFVDMPSVRSHIPKLALRLLSKNARSVAAQPNSIQSWRVPSLCHSCSYCQFSVV